jgi:hypothetical protein
VEGFTPQKGKDSPPLKREKRKKTPPQIIKGGRIHPPKEEENTLENQPKGEGFTPHGFRVFRKLDVYNLN